MEYTATRDDNSVLYSKLTPRERDCLRLLSGGLLTAEVKAELGISQSTLDAHLASSRRKLGVQTTLQAVVKLLDCSNKKTQASNLASLNFNQDADECSEGQIALADRLDACQTFGKAWEALHDYLLGLGIVATNFGFIGDPTGYIEEGSCTFISSLPSDVVALYHGFGGPPVCPVANYLSRNVKPISIDPESSVALNAEKPLPVRRFDECLLDNRLNRMFCIPGRDPATRAPFGMVFAYEHRSASEFKAATLEQTEELRRLVSLFWGSVHTSGLLAGLSRLTTREREVLQFVMRGFSVSELAERIHVSRRSAEKLLASARAKLAARNNAQAVYRAMVYGALV